MHNLANCYFAVGRRDDALKLREETLAGCQRVLGPDHPRTLAAMNTLANSYFARGRPADACKLQEETLAARRRVLNPDHPDTLTTMNNLADSYEALGRLADAHKLREETLAAARRVHGPDHPETLRNMGSIAESLVKLKRGAEAVPLIDECVARAAGKVLDPGLIPAVMDLRLRYFQQAGDPAGCRTTADLWEKLHRTDARSLYSAACYRAVVAAVQTATPGPDAARLAAEDADKAMAWLPQAIAAGYKDRAHLENDKDLDALRGRGDFRKLLASLPAASPPPGAKR
jgi:tetratricopeptide (TPR) repeat protein